MLSKNTWLLASSVLMGTAFSFSVSTSTVYADDANVSEALANANAAYARRSVSDSTPVDQAIAILQKVEGKATDANLNFDVLVLESRALYWKGVYTQNSDEKKALFNQGQSKANDAKQVNPGFADSYYYAGINLGRWAEVNGAMASLFKLNELKSYMNDTISHSTRNDHPGSSIDGNGPDRVLGRIYFKLPGIAGGDRKKSLGYLKNAYTNAGNYAINVNYYAETLYQKGTSEEKAEAKRILDVMLAQKPELFNPNRIVETVEEFKEGADLRSKMK